MASQKAAWGMEVGAHAIKALRLERDGDKVAVTDFAIIPLKRVLATPDIDENEIIRLALGQFISQKALEGEHLVMSVPGHAAFARFAKLPPVEPKKVADIVKFEAVQQIPFPIDEVEWDYQTFVSADSPEVEVGIFAITRERVQQRLNLYSELGISPEALTLSPVAVFNAMSFDHNLAKRKEPVIYLDIGTYATDVVIADRGRCWIRTFPLGGTHFTEAIARTFKLGYSKADKLKQEAAASKYAKQIMQAMRPVFSDLLQDLQRSIGYYQTLHREAELKTMVGIGSTFKIPGLRKFLGQQLQLNVIRLDEYKQISVGGRDAASFAQNAVGMATAYGLALQGVGLAQIDVNLVPVEALRAQLWHEKTKWFAAAAAIAVAGAGMMLYRPIADKGAMSPTPPPVVARVLSTGDRLKREYDELQMTADVGFAAENFRRLVDYRDIWPYLVHDAADALASTKPQADLLGGDLDKIRAIKPQERRLVRLRHLDGNYTFDAAAKTRTIHVTMRVELSHDRPIEFLNDTVAQWLRDNAERPDVPYRIISASVRCNPDLLEIVRVTDKGEQLIGGGKPSGGGAGGPPKIRDRPTDPSQSPPGPPAAGGSAGGFGMSGGGGAGMPGRRERSGQRQAPPGAGLGGVGTGFGSPPPAPSNPPGGMGAGDLGRRTGQTPGDGRSNDRRSADLDKLAPLPDRPSLYPADSTYFLVPVTFEIELITRPDAPAPEQTAGIRSRRQGVGS